MSLTQRIENLLRALEGRGFWTPDEQRDVEEIIMGKDPDDSYLPTDGSRKRKPFEIEGEWPRETTGDPLRLDESRPVPSGPSRPALGEPRDETQPASLEERVATLERREQAFWAAIHALEARLGVAKED